MEALGLRFPRIRPDLRRSLDHTHLKAASVLTLRQEAMRPVASLSTRAVVSLRPRTACRVACPAFDTKSNTIGPMPAGKSSPWILYGLQFRRDEASSRGSGGCSGLDARPGGGTAWRRGLGRAFAALVLSLAVGPVLCLTGQDAPPRR